MKKVFSFQTAASTIIAILFAVVGLTIAMSSCSNGHETNAGPASDSTVAATSKDSAVVIAAEQPAFDVPSLIGGKIQDIYTKYGPSVDGYKPTEPINKKEKEADATFHHGRFALNIVFNTKTMLATNYTVADTSYAVNDYKLLLKAGHLKENDNRYSIKVHPYFEDSSKIASIEMIPVKP